MRQLAREAEDVLSLTSTDFHCVDEHYLDPPKDLALARAKYGLEEDEFRVVPPGRTLSWGRE